MRPVAEVQYTWHTIEASDAHQNFHLVQRYLADTQQGQFKLQAKLGSTVASASLETIKENAQKMFNLQINEATYNESW